MTVLCRECGAKATLGVKYNFLGGASLLNCFCSHHCVDSFYGLDYMSLSNCFGDNYKLIEGEDYIAYCAMEAL